MFKSRGKALRVLILVLTMMVLTFQVASAQDRCHAIVEKLSCVYDGSSSTWGVKITLWGYKIELNGVTYENKESNNQVTNITLPAGNYTYKQWEWDGHEWDRKSDGHLNMDSCALPHASASVALGDCTPGTPTSTSAVSITIDHATVSINGNSYTSSTNISLAPGSYPWTWVAQSGYWGSGGGTLVVGSCEFPPADASVVLGVCTPGTPTSTSAVAITVDHATVSINGSDYSASTTIDLAPGSYPWTWVAAPGYSGGGGGTLVVGTCEFPEADASVSLGACTANVPGVPSSTVVNIVVSNATLTIAGTDYTSSTSIDLGPGSYPWSWVADAGYVGGDSGTLIVDDCSPKFQADVSFDVGVCHWGGEVFEREVALTIDGATVTLVGGPGNKSYGPYTSSQTITIPCGVYTYAWSAADPAYEGSGSGTLTLLECDQSKAYAVADIGSCGFSDGDSLTVVNISVQSALFTIDGVTYDASTSIKLPKGDYPYSWGPASGEFSGSGEGILSIGSCEPKTTVDEQPDVAAGGSGPQLFASISPMLAGLVGLAGAWWLVRTEKKKTF